MKVNDPELIANNDRELKMMSICEEVASITRVLHEALRTTIEQGKVERISTYIHTLKQRVITLSKLSNSYNKGGATTNPYTDQYVEETNTNVEMVYPSPDDVYIEEEEVVEPVEPDESYEQNPEIVNDDHLVPPKANKRKKAPRKPRMPKGKLIRDNKSNAQKN